MRKVVIIGLTSVLLSGGLLVASADVPHSTTGVYTACVRNLNGNVRLIDKEAGESCNAFETEKSWNKVGPQGPAGPQGETGPAGPQGEPGGLAGYELVTKIREPSEDLSGGRSPGDESNTITCPPGKIVLSGGIKPYTSTTISGNAPEPYIVETRGAPSNFSYPSADNAWTTVVIAHWNGYTMYALCANA